MLLLCVALNGYHSEACHYKWEWEKDSDSTSLSCEEYPVVYATHEGQYTCTCTVEGEQHKAVGVFYVTS